MKKKIILFFIFLSISILSIVFIFVQALRVDKGYRVISISALNLPVEVYLNYDIGHASSKNLKTELDEVTSVYTKAYKYIYSQIDTIDDKDTHNMFYINQHYNEMLDIQPVLYEALMACISKDESILYYGPIFKYYEDYLSIESMDILHKQDPYQNENVQQYFLKIIDFIQQQSIRLEFFHDYKVRLEIDEDYLKFCKENEIDRYIDFGVLKNAVCMEYIANSLIDSGHIYGYLQSTDGMFQGLCSTMKYTIDLYDEYKDVVQRIGQIDVEGAISLVQFHAFTVPSVKIGSTYRNYYINKKDGLSKNAFPSIISYSNQLSMIEVFLDGYLRVTGDVVISHPDSIEYVWIKDTIVKYTDMDLEIVSLLEVYQRKHQYEIF